MRLLFLFIFLLFSGNIFSQLGFCPGSKGDPIFHEDFGAGTSTGAPLGPAVTNYQFVTGDPNDGQYTISGRIGQNNTTWHSRFPQTTISNGRALIVNANDNTAGKFYEFSVSNLCEATTYEFSAFLMNVYDAGSVDVCPGTGIPINVRFEIWDETNSKILAEGSTGDIHGARNPKWEQYALVFRSQPGQNKVVLKMFNNGIGGCGNDLAIDDIIFRSCGDLTEVSSAEIDKDELVVCPQDVPAKVNLTATPDFSVYNTHAFQWQESIDGENWQDLPGETKANFSSEAISTSKYFRVKVAEDEVNLDDSFCSSASEAFAVIITKTPRAPVSLGNVTACRGDAIPALRVQILEDEEVFWYDAPTGGNIIAAGNPNFVPEEAGTYYAETKKINADCAASNRTAVTLNLFPKPEVSDESLQLCPDQPLILDAGAGNYSYLWASGETTRQIVITQPGNYSVAITNTQGCAAVKNFEVKTADIAGISGVRSEGSTVIIIPENSGSFQYSLDGINFGDSNVFTNISGGIYTAYQRDLAGCKTVSKEFPHIVIPKYITPNNDGYNDRFELKGVEYFKASEIRIFDRYGRLVAHGKGEDFSWNGLLHERELPAADYWYHIFIDGFEPVKGSFSLLR
ncbi:MAG: T9SS type B sorting domain-containing protein [Salinimicrobium sediminis]|nr:T9SS type B sorting domain-containing protein [Salinimicrobium sediminis]